MTRQPTTIHCEWNSCERTFASKSEYRRHCVWHINKSIGAFLVDLPTETWAEVLSICGPNSLLERICFSRRLFHAISRPLLDGPKVRILPEMAFVRRYPENDVILVKYVENGRWGYRLEELPVAEVAPPPNVVGFQQIELRCFNSKVLSFLYAIRSLFNDVWLELEDYSNLLHTRWTTVNPQHRYRLQLGSDLHNLETLECLLRVFPRRERSITSLCILSGTNLISADLLALLLTNVRHLRINQCTLPKRETMSLMGTHSNNCSPYLPVLVKWLHTPIGGQKMASLNVGNIENLAEFVTQAQQHFLSAKSAPVPYFVIFHSDALEYVRHVELPFNRMRNECTGEVLTLRHYNEVFDLGGYWHNFVLYRRISASEPTEENEEPELAAIFETLPHTLFSTEPHNRLVVNVAQMDAIDESLFPVDSEEQNGAEGNEPGPSNAM